MMLCTLTRILNKTRITEISIWGKSEVITMLHSGNALLVVVSYMNIAVMNERSIIELLLLLLLFATC